MKLDKRGIEIAAEIALERLGDVTEYPVETVEMIITAYLREANRLRSMDDLKDGDKAAIVTFKKNKIKFFGYRRGDTMIPIHFGTIPVDQCAGWLHLPKRAEPVEPTHE